MFKTPGVNIYRYQSREELRLEHPEIKSLTLVHQAPRGQSAEVQREGVRKAMLRSGHWSNTIFQIGDQFWMAASECQPAYVRRELTS